MRPAVYNIANNQADILKSRNIELVPKKGTFIETLYKDFGPFTYSENVGYEASLDTIINQLSNYVNAHIKFARATVIPEIKDYADNVQSALDVVSQKNPMSEFCIIVDDLPEFIDDYSLEDVINVYKDKIPLVPSKSSISFMINETESDNSLLSLIKSGDESLDQAVNDWLVTLSKDGSIKDILMEVWNNYFGNKRSYQELLSKSYFEQIRDGIILFLMSRNLDNDATFIQEGNNLSKANSFIQEVRDFSGTTIARALEKIKHLKNSNILINEINSDKNIIHVNGDVYRDWLKEGGKHEALYGVLISRETVSTKISLVEKQDRFIAAWTTFSALYSARMKSSMFEQFKLILRNEFDKSLSDPTDEEKDIRQSDSKYIETVTKLFEGFMNSLSYKDVDDVYGVCSNIICKARFYFTDAYKIVQGIEEACLSNKQLDIREAALLSTIRYVTDFVADQISVQRV